jgi:type IV pilus assembly protein PilA
MTNTFFQSILNKKATTKKQNGFTMIELMVVVGIIGVLSSVALPAMTKAQAKAESSAAKQTAVNAAKTCTIAIIGGDADEIDAADVDEVTEGAVTNSAIVCSDSAPYAFTGGGDTWTVTLADGIGGSPAKSA